MALGTVDLLVGDRLTGGSQLGIPWSLRGSCESNGSFVSPSAGPAEAAHPELLVVFPVMPRAFGAERQWLWHWPRWVPGWDPDGNRMGNSDRCGTTHVFSEKDLKTVGFSTSILGWQEGFRKLMRKAPNVDGPVLFGCSQWDSPYLGWYTSKNLFQDPDPRVGWRELKGLFLNLRDSRSLILILLGFVI